MKKIIAVAAVTPLLLAAIPMFASACSSSWCRRSDSNKTIVTSTNYATVTNNVTSNANTGNNQATGNSGNSGENQNGVVETGNASAESTVITGVNANYTSVSTCGCSSREGSFVKVENSNGANVINNVSAYSNTGYNQANSNSNNKNTGANGLNGLVNTGSAHSASGVVTIGNVNITEIN